MALDAASTFTSPQAMNTFAWGKHAVRCGPRGARRLWRKATTRPPYDLCQSPLNRLCGASSVISVGVLIPFAWLDNSLDSWLRDTFGVSSGLLLTGGIAAMVLPTWSLSGGRCNRGLASPGSGLDG